MITGEQKGRYTGFLQFILLLFFIPAVFFLSEGGISSAFADVTVDNGGLGSSSTGTWSNSSGPLSYGTTSVFARPVATYTWHLDSQPAGDYEVLMWWTVVSSRGSDISVDIDTGSEIHTVSIDQTQNGGQWNSLGTYSFGSGSGSVTITASSDLLPGGGTVSTCADAVWFQYASSNNPPTATIDSITPNPADVGDPVSFTGHGDDSDGSVVGYEWVSSIDGLLNDTDASYTTATLSQGTHNITFRVQDNEGVWSVPTEDVLTVGDVQVDHIVDNGGGGTSSTGTWSNSSGPLSYGTTSVFARPVATYTWHLDSQPAGDYEVLMWWTVVSSRGSDISVDIDTGSEIHTVSIDQTQNGGQWNSLGTYSFGSGSGSVTITASSDLLPGGGIVSTCADAVRFTSVSGNTPPMATIDSITPNPADVGDPVSFTGHGDDSDGSVVGYEWVSSIDGLLNDTDASFTTATLSQGTHNITFRVFDDNGAASDWVTHPDLIIQGIATNNPPTATIDSITPNPADVGDPVSFTGHGDDSDGSVVGYEWVSSIDGLLNDTDASFTTATLSQGTHNITFRVFDDNGAASDWVTHPDLIIQGIATNNPPTATIDSITPNPADVGDPVSFTGHGDDSDGSVVGYEWVSSIDGLLNDTDASYTTATLSQGTHNITFRVQDNEGVWSVPTEDVLTVGDVQVDHIVDNGGGGTSSTGTWSNSSGPLSYGTTSVFARPVATYTWHLDSQPAGDYEVLMWWTVVSSRGSDISVDIDTGSEIHTVSIDQTQNGGQWNSLGTYSFGSGSGSVTITASSDLLPGGGIVSTCADAVRFRNAGASGELPPIANFSASPTNGVMPVTVEFSDLSTGDADTWLWNFGDGETSTEQSPTHIYSNIGSYTVSLTCSNDFGSDTETKSAFIQVYSSGSNVENIYVALGYGSNRWQWDESAEEISDLGGVEIEPDLWRYTNTDKGVTYYIGPIDTVEAFEAAIREEGSHIIYIGHSNYGWGLGFLSEAQQGYVQYFDDPLVSNVSTDMTDPSISGLRFGQAYPNWNPEYSFGGSAIMPYDFGDPRGLPPYNYFATYTLPGDPTHYRIEAADGSYIERFPDSGRPAWYSPDGSLPDPVLNPEYFITNTAENWERCEFVGTWQYESPGDWHTAVYYIGQNYQLHTPGVGNNSATYTFPVATPGVYAVVATWYPDPANASNATYTIQHTNVGTGEYDTVVVDQRQSLGFNTLGAFYFDTGSYTVEITDNADGNVISDLVALMYVNDPQIVTKAEFSVDQNTGAGPITVQFIDQSTVYINTNPAPQIQWQWDFGDGTLSQEQNPMHTYTAPGIYTVSLTVTDELGNTDNEIKDSFIIVDRVEPLNAQFTANNIIGSSGAAAVNFLNQSTGDITEWFWDFGDSTTSTERNPTHTYVEGGSFTVTLTVTGPGGSDSETETDFVYVTVGMVIVDNTFDTKPHYYRNYSGTILGSTIMDASPVAFPNEEMRYSRLFFNGCVSEHYYVPKFTRGVVFYTLTNRSAASDPTDEYIRRYLLGDTDDEILQAINAVNYIHGYYDFNQLPPSMR